MLVLPVLPYPMIILPFAAERDDGQKKPPPSTRAHMLLDNGKICYAYSTQLRNCQVHMEHRLDAPYLDYIPCPCEKINHTYIH